MNDLKTQINELLKTNRDFYAFTDALENYAADKYGIDVELFTFRRKINNLKEKANGQKQFVAWLAGYISRLTETQERAESHQNQTSLFKPTNQRYYEYNYRKPNFG